MTRTVTLTYDDLRRLYERAGHAGFDDEEIDQHIAAVRTPPNPDAGLGAQPWKLELAHGKTEIRSADYQWVIARVSSKGFAPHDPAAVVRAILAAPKAIKLARMIIKQRVSSPHLWSPEAIAWDNIAAEVVAIADGTS